MMDTEAKLAVHEVVCEERYKKIQERFDDGSKRMGRIEHLLYGVILIVLFGPGVAGEFIKHVLKL
mgnify:FL=1